MNEKKIKKKLKKGQRSYDRCGSIGRGVCIMDAYSQRSYDRWAREGGRGRGSGRGPLGWGRGEGEGQW